MQIRLNDLAYLGLWLLFFASSVYGHVAFRFVTTDEPVDLLRTLLSFWGITALLSWAASVILWIFILSRTSLLHASSISSLSYVCIVLAAVLLFRESISLSQAAGVALVAAGIALVVR